MQRTIYKRVPKSVAICEPRRVEPAQLTLAESASWLDYVRRTAPVGSSSPDWTSLFGVEESERFLGSIIVGRFYGDTMQYSHVGSFLRPIWLPTSSAATTAEIELPTFEESTIYREIATGAWQREQWYIGRAALAHTMGETYYEACRLWIEGDGVPYRRLVFFALESAAH